MITKIKNIENEYWEFMEMSYKINYGIKPFDIKENPDSPIYFVKKNIKNPPPILYIEKHIFDIKNYNPIPILYHEFTHLYHDQHLLYGMYDNPITQYNMTTYFSEFWAVITQMKYATGFKKYNESKNIYLDNNINFEFYNCDLQTFLTDYTKDCTGTINNLLKQNEINKRDIFLFTIYYFAIINFLDMYCEDNIEKINMKQYFVDIWGENLIEYISTLSNPNPTKEMLVKSFKIYMSLMEFFNAKFLPGKYQKKLYTFLSRIIN